MVFVSHDIQTVRKMSDRIVTMYLGRIVEEAPAADLPGAAAPPVHAGAVLRDAEPAAHRRTDRAERARPVGDRAAERVQLPHPVLEGDRRLRA